MRESSVAEQRYQAALAMIKDGRTVTEAAAAAGCGCRRCMPGWASTKRVVLNGWSMGRIGR
jgi:hypothetical protein